MLHVTSCATSGQSVNGMFTGDRSTSRPRLPARMRRSANYCNRGTVGRACKGESTDDSRVCVVLKAGEVVWIFFATHPHSPSGLYGHSHLRTRSAERVDRRCQVLADVSARLRVLEVVRIRQHLTVRFRRDRRHVVSRKCFVGAHRFVVVRAVAYILPVAVSVVQIADAKIVCCDLAAALRQPATPHC